MVEWKKLGEVCEILDSQRKPVAKEERSQGIYPYYGANGIQDYVSSYIFDGTFLLMGEDGSVINKDKSPVLHWTEGRIWVNNHAHILKENERALLRYLYYSLQCTDVSDIVRGVPPKINQANMRNIPIPIPSLSEQSRIVSILDTFTSSISNLKQQIEERRKQYEYERDLLLDLEGKEGVEMKKLGEVGDICMCKRIMKNQTSDVGDIPFFKIGTFGGVPDAYISRELFEDYKEKYSYPKKGEILISAAGTIGRTVVFNGEDAYFQDSNIVWISNNEQLVLNTFLRYLYGVIDWKIDGGTIKRLYNYNLKNATIYVPTLQAQSRIVSILDTFEQSISNLEEQLAMREKQYEYYRNQLLTFEGEEERGKT